MGCRGKRGVRKWMYAYLTVCSLVFLNACFFVRNVSAEANFQTSTVSGLTSAYHIVSADFNNDTIADLAVTQWSANQVTVLLGNGHGGFTTGATLTTGVHPNFIAIGNLDSVGGIDLAVTNGGGARDVTLFFNNGTGTSWSTSTLNIGSDADVSSLVAASLTSNTDTNMDLFIVKDSGVTTDSYEVWQGNGAGLFTEITSASGGTGNLPIFAASADLNGDGGPDMVIANYLDNTMTILLGNGDGTFSQASGSPITVGINPRSIATGNLNGDVHVDLVVANAGGNTLTILLGNGDGTFTGGGSFSVSGGPASAAIADFDGDGINDIAVSRWSINMVSIYYGIGDGTFNTTPTSVSVGTNPFFLAATDLDRDGRTDLAVTNYGSNDVTILLNRTGICLTPPADMVLWLSGDGHPFDLLGVNNGTMMNGADYGTGKVGRAFNFDGVDDYVEVDVGIDNFGTAPFTVEFWMYSRNDGNGTYIVGKSHPDGGLGWDIRLHNNEIQVVGVNGWGVNITSDASVTRDAWHHIALSSTETTVALYIDGAFKGTSPRSAISVTTNPGRIGYTTNFSGTAFNGLIDEGQLFNRALTSEEIMAIYNAGGMGTCKPCFTPPSGLVSWWTGDGNANDIIGANNGTMNGATFEAGKVDQAFSFDGTNDSVDLPDSASILISNSAGTITVWVNPAAVGDNDIVVAYGSGGAGEGIGIGIYGNVRIYHHTGSYDWQSTTPVNANEWTMLTYAWDTTTETIYKNGVFMESRARSGPWNWSYVPGYARIGHGFWGDGANAFPGLIDEVAAFSRALTTEEIAAIHGAGSSGICIPPDTIPDQFTFNDQTNVALNSLIESNQVTIAGIETSSPISITGGEYSINNGAYTPLAGTVQNGQSVRVRQTSSSSYSTTTNATLTIGGVSDTFSVTTIIEPDTTPDPFAFTDQTGVSLNTVVESEVITVTGINVSVAISIIGGEYSVDGGSYTSTASTVSNGETVRVRQISSSSYATTTNTILTIGGVSDTFSVTTVAPPQYTISFSSAGHGAIVCVPSTVVLGNNSVCTMTPDPGYLLASLTDNGTDVMNAVSNNTYTISNVTEAHSVEATFDRFDFTPENGTLGTVIAITGPGFGVKKGKVYLEKDGVRYATKVSEWNLGGTNNLIKVSVSKMPTAGRYRIMLVLKNIGTIISENTFEVIDPVVDSASVALVDGKRVVTIQGEYFGSWKKPKVYFNNGTKDLSCKVISTANTEVRCYPHKSVVTGTYTVKVIVGKVLMGQRVLDITMP